MPSPLRSVLAPLGGGNLVIMANGLMATLVGLQLVAAGTPTWAVGLVQGAYFAGLALGALLCDRVIRRVGHIRAFAAYAGLLTALALCHALLVHPVLWLGLRAASGFSAAVLLAVTESWLNARATPRSRGLILGVYMASVQTSMALGQLGLLAVDLGLTMVFVGPALIYSLSLTPVALTGALQPEIPAGGRMSVRALARVAPLGVTGTFLAGAVAGTLYTLGAVHARGIGLGDDEIAVFMAVLLFGGVLLQFPLGRLSDRVDRRLVLGAVAAALAVASGALYVWAPRHPGALLPAIALVSGLAFVLYPLALAHTNDLLEPAQILPAAGLALLLYAVGATAGPALASAAMSLLGPGGLHVFVAAAGALLLLHVLVRLVRRGPAPAQDREAYVTITLPTAAPGATELQTPGTVSAPSPRPPRPTATGTWP